MPDHCGQAPCLPPAAAGRAFDSAGAALPEDGLTWSVDGAVIAQHAAQVIAQDMVPGEHTATLSYAPQGKTVAEVSTHFVIAKPNRKSKQFAAFQAKLAAAVDPDPVIHEMTAAVPGGGGKDGDCGCQRRR